MHKAPFVFPIIGGRKVEHLLANVEALNISLSRKQIQFLENAVPFDPGFPTTMIVGHIAIHDALANYMVISREMVNSRAVSLQHPRPLRVYLRSNPFQLRTWMIAQLRVIKLTSVLVSTCIKTQTECTFGLK